MREVNFLKIDDVSKDKSTQTLSIHFLLLAIKAKLALFLTNNIFKLNIKIKFQIVNYICFVFFVLSGQLIGPVELFTGSIFTGSIFWPLYENFIYSMSLSS